MKNQIKKGKAFHGQMAARVDGQDLLIANLSPYGMNWGVRVPGGAAKFDDLPEGEFWNWTELELLWDNFFLMTETYPKITHQEWIAPWKAAKSIEDFMGGPEELSEEQLQDAMDAAAEMDGVKISDFEKYPFRPTN